MNFYELDEATTRYSVEVNYRTTIKEMKEGFAKLLLGYVSAALKERNYHVKKIFDEEPYRIIVSAHNWTDGEWVLIVSYNSKQDCFVLSKGFYNRDRQTVTVQSSEKCEGGSAADIFRALFNKMNKIKEEKPHHMGDLKGVKGKTGPKQGKTRPAQRYQTQQQIKQQTQPSNNDKMGM